MFGNKLVVTLYQMHEYRVCVQHVIYGDDNTAKIIDGIDLISHGPHLFRSHDAFSPFLSVSKEQTATSISMLTTVHPASPNL